jgi:peptide/nickel transport system permease protein
MNLYQANDRLVRLALYTFAAIVVFCLSAPIAAKISGLDPDLADLYHRFQPPDGRHPLGTDEAGRDLMLRLMIGGRTSLLIGLVSALTSAAIGAMIGLTAGYFGGRWDRFLMRLTDGIIALPLLPLLIVAAAIDLTKLGLPADWAQSPGANFWRLVLIIALVQWTTAARLVRASTLSELTRDYVASARTQGAGVFHLMGRHILPAAFPALLTATTLSVGQIILFESVLSFLGLGIMPPAASWGNMLNAAQALLYDAPTLGLYPGALLFATVLSINLIGDGLRRRLSPI